MSKSITLTEDQLAEILANYTLKKRPGKPKPKADKPKAEKVRPEKPITEEDVAQPKNYYQKRKTIIDECKALGIPVKTKKECIVTRSLRELEYELNCRKEAH
jgi:hypothetical protein